MPGNQLSGQVFRPMIRGAIGNTATRIKMQRCGSVHEY